MEEFECMDKELDEMDMKMLNCPMMGCPLLQWAITNCPTMHMAPMQGMPMTPMQGMPMTPMQGMQMMPMQGAPMMPMQDMPMMPGQDIQDMNMPPVPIQGIPMKPMGPESTQVMPPTHTPMQEKPAGSKPIQCTPDTVPKKCKGCEWDVKNWCDEDERLFGAGE